MGSLLPNLSFIFVSERLNFCRWYFLLTEQLIFVWMQFSCELIKLSLETFFCRLFEVLKLFLSGLNHIIFFLDEVHEHLVFLFEVRILYFEVSYFHSDLKTVMVLLSFDMFASGKCDMLMKLRSFWISLETFEYFFQFHNFLV